MKKFILDTNAYDYILDNNIDTSLLAEFGNLYITNVQISEIKNITNANRRTALLTLLNALNPIKLNLESGIWLNDLYWDDEQPWIDSVSDTVYSLLGNSLNKKPYKDALIGEVAKNNNLTMVTNDITFGKKAFLVGIDTITIQDFLNLSK